MGFHAFGEFRMTRATFERLEDHARSEFAALVREHLSQTGQERDMHPDIARWLDRAHAYRIPADGLDNYGRDDALTGAAPVSALEAVA